MLINFRDSHAYPGCGVRIDTLPETGDKLAVAVEFSDGTRATAQCTIGNAEEIKVWIDGYTTNSGNTVKPRAWQIKRAPGAPIWKVSARIGAM